MKRIIIKSISKTGHLLLPILLTALIIGLLPVDTIKAKTTGDVTENISLPTIQCNMCVNNISEALDKVKGIKDYNVDLAGKKVTVTYDEGVTTISKIEKTISKAGYDANNKKADKKAYDKLDECCKVK